MDFLKLEGKELSKDIFDQLVEMEKNCGLEPYTPQMLWECVTEMDTYACMDGNTVAGFITLHPSTRYLGGGVYMVNLNVSAPYRRRGVASGLVLFACSRYLMTRFHDRVTLDVAKSNAPAQALYKKLGFSCTDEPSGNGDTDVVMAAPLARLLRAVKTPRLTLCLPTSWDIPEGAEILMNDCVKKTYMVPDLTQEAAEKLFNRICTLARDPARYIRGIYLEGKLIGFLNDTEISGQSIELGWALHPEYHNQGYCTEAVRAAIDDLFALGFREVTAGAFAENPASLRVMEKSGMTRLQKTDDIEYRGKTHTCIYYARRKPE